MSAADVAVLPKAEAGSGVARASAFVAAFALVLVTLHPFEDLREALPTAPVTGRDTLTYFAFFAVAGAGFALARKHAAPAFAALKRPAYLALGAWALMSSLTSYDPATSLKRVILCYLVAATAAAAPLLPRGRSEMAGLIALALSIPIGLSYLGVILLPHLSIHSLADTLEPELDGDWRGVFSHKNVASPVFGFFAYFGFYLWRAGRKRDGALIGLASLVFLYFTGGKTSSALWLPAGLIGFMATRGAVGFVTGVVILAPPIILSGLGFGAQLSPTLASLAASLPFDNSFTGRADVWRFAAQKMLERPIAGRGFDSFWDDPALRANAEQGWVANAAHAHNGYVDATLAMGLIGLALTLWAFVLQPLADLGAAARRGVDPALTTLCAQILVYGIWVSSLETFLYDRANPVWFLFLFAVFTLRYLANFRVAP
jgi:O-antigen ligase